MAKITYCDKQGKEALKAKRAAEKATARKRATYTEKRGLITRLALEINANGNRRTRKEAAKRRLKYIKLMVLGKHSEAAKYRDYLWRNN